MVEQRKRITIMALGCISCPWCYISKRRLLRAATLLADTVVFEFVWIPFPWDREAPLEVNKHDYYASKMGAGKLRQTLPRTTRVFEEEGLSYTLDGRMGCTLDAHRLLVWAGQEYGSAKQGALLENLYHAFHCEAKFVGCTPEGHANIASAAAAAGLPGSEAQAVLADAGAYRSHVDAYLSAHRGVTDLPHLNIECFRPKHQEAARTMTLSGAKTVDEYVSCLRQLVHDVDSDDLHDQLRRRPCSDRAVARGLEERPLSPRPLTPPKRLSISADPRILPCGTTASSQLASPASQRHLPLGQAGRPPPGHWSSYYRASGSMVSAADRADSMATLIQALSGQGKQGGRGSFSRAPAGSCRAPGEPAAGHEAAPAGLQERRQFKSMLNLQLPAAPRVSEGGGCASAGASRGTGTGGGQAALSPTARESGCGSAAALPLLPHPPHQQQQHHNQHQPHQHQQQPHHHQQQQQDVFEGGVPAAAGGGGTQAGNAYTSAKERVRSLLPPVFKRILKQPA